MRLYFSGKVVGAWVWRNLHEDESAMRAIRSIASLASLVAAALGFFAVASTARAQVASTPPAPGSGGGWIFSITPYAWLPTVSTTYSYPRPRAGTVTNTISAGIGDYISELNFGLMVGGTGYRKCRRPQR
jgi:hypothetical protein